ncbi:condensation domain-containing protein [Spirillospora sp. NPDC048824]|uniref:condensation domain-containing protein n=1 Tax=Spirillospora sp. NPDC048824 TaxID=3364526 RepID=UPI00371C1EBD
MWLAQEVGGVEDRSLAAAHTYGLAGRLEIDALHAGLNAVLARHEVLRTGFALCDGDLHQVVGVPSELDLRVEETDDGHELSARIRTFADIPFDMAQGPLLRARLFRLAADRHVLCVVFHHIANDGWSMEIFHRELAALYGAAIDLPGVTDPIALSDLAELDRLPFQYADFAVWQDGQAQHPETHAEALAHWRSRLAGAPPLLTLPTDRPRNDVRSSAGDRVEFDLLKPTVERATEVASAYGTTLFTFQCAAFQALLAAWSGQSDTVIGITTANRSLPETESLIGFFVNVLPLRGTYRPADAFAEFLAETAGALIEAYRHETLPFELLLEHLATPREAGYNPLVQVTVASHQELAAPLCLPHLVVEHLEPERHYVQEDLTLYLTTAGAGSRGYLDFRTDLFDRPTIEAFAESFVRFIGLAADGPDTSLGSLVEQAGLRCGRAPSGPDGAGAAEPARTGDAMLSTATEHLVAEVWQDILNCRSLGADDVFFKLGGTSMAATRVANRLSERLGPGITVRVRDVFLHSRLDALAERVDELVARAEGNGR